MAQEEVLFKLSVIEQQSEEIKKQLEELERQDSDLSGLKESLKKLKPGKEILANLGRGIFIKSKVEDEKVFVNVGSKVLVRKSFLEAIDIIDKQLAEIAHIKNELVSNFNFLNSELHKLSDEAQREKD